MSETATDGRFDGRGQFVLLAAGLIAVGLVPVLFASLQLSYAGDLDALSAEDDPIIDARGHLEPAVNRAGGGIADNYTWPERRSAARAVSTRLDRAFGALERSDLADGTVYAVEPNATAAAAWADSNCPRGPNRRFGECEAWGAVVVQERAGLAHVLGVALDVTVTGRERTVRATLRVWVVARH